MSLIFDKRKRTKRPKGMKPFGDKDRNPPAAGEHKTIKYVELFGTIASGALAAGLSRKIIDYDIPDAHGAELYAVGVDPDWLAPNSNMLDTEIGYDGKLTGIKFLTNHNGRNTLPYGDRSNRQDIRLLDYPQRRGNLTPKFNDAMRLQIVVTMGAGGANLSDIHCRAKVLLYEEADCMATFGVPVSRIATVPGGVEQAMPQRLFADYKDAFVTGGAAQWEDAYTKALKEYEEVKLSHIGVLPDVNLRQVKLLDLRLKKEFPEWEPYFHCEPVYNALSMGDDDDHRPTTKLPSVVASHSYTNTTMTVKVKDAAVASTVYIQLLGTYRRLGTFGRMI